MKFFKRRRTPAVPTNQSSVPLDVTLQATLQVLLDMDMRLTALEAKIDDIHAAYQGLNGLK